MTRHHLIISGTGRAGTTFLVQLLTKLGLDTGFPDPSSGIWANCNAGMELDIRLPDAPYVIKNPRLCGYLDEVLSQGDVIIDHALIPIRDLESAAESRRAVARKAGPASARGEVPGGLWDTDTPEQQEEALAVHFHRLIETVTKHGIPSTLLDFPRFIHDPKYLYAMIGFVVAGTGYERFLEAFRAVARPELVHDFRGDRAMAGAASNVAH
jgi:hypothetical protein